MPPPSARALRGNSPTAAGADHRDPRASPTRVYRRAVPPSGQTGREVLYRISRSCRRNRKSADRRQWPCAVPRCRPRFSGPGRKRCRRRSSRRQGRNSSNPPGRGTSVVAPAPGTGRWGSTRARLRSGEQASCACGRLSSGAERDFSELRRWARAGESWHRSLPRGGRANGGQGCLAPGMPLVRRDTDPGFC